MDFKRYAGVGDSIGCTVANPTPQKITVRLETPEAAAYANTLLANERSGWRKVDLPHHAELSGGGTPSA